MPDYVLDDDPSRVDLDADCDFLTTEAYWMRWRTPEVIREQVRTAWRVVGAYTADGELAGFARAVGDGFSVAYLADVFVLAQHRGHGLGKRLVHLMIDDGPGADFRWMLHTRDAHDLYRKFGFAEPDERYLERQPQLDRR